MSTFKNKESDPLRIVFWMFFPILFILFINFGGAYAQLDSAIDSYETLYQDDFSDETTGWYIKQDILDSGTYTYSLTDGTYRWEYELKQGAYRYILIPGKMNLPDDGFRISVDIQFESAFSGTDAGIIFNFQDKDNFYFAKLDTQGIASIYAKENGKWVLLSEKIQSEKFDPSGINNMTVVYDTGNYEIRINDIPTVRLADSRFHGGTVALIMEGNENTNPTTRFDNLTIMKKKSAQAETENKAASYETLYQDDFSDETTGWYIKQDILDSGTYTYSLTDGTYRWEYELKQGAYRYILIPGKMNLPDDGFRISVDIQFESAFSGTDAGIIFNFQDKDNFYFAKLDTQGIASIYAKENGKWVLLSEKIQSEKFDPSGINNMTVVYDTGNYEIRINDIPTVRLADSRFHGGTVALIMEGNENTNPTTRFDNLTIMKKKSAQAETENKADSYETVYQQDFTEQAADWNFEPMQGDWGVINFSVTDGTYRCEMNLDKGQLRLLFPNPPINVPKDGYQISVDIQLESSCPGCGPGILFSYQENGNFYFAGIDPNGTVAVYAKEDKWTPLSDNVPIKDFDPSRKNKLTVINDGDNYEIRVNDISLIHITDSRFRGGVFGLLIQGKENTNPTTRFDNLTITKKKSAQAETENKTDAYETVYQQDFTEQAADWNFEPMQGDWGVINFSVTDGTYRCEMNLDKGQLRLLFPNPPINVPKDGYQISVDIQLESSCPGCGPGILFSYQENGNFYFAGIDPNGTVAVYAKEDKWTPLSDNVPIKDFDPSRKNKLTVINDGDNYEIKVNDISLIHITDSRFRGGVFGLLIQGKEKTNTATRFDNLTIMKKKSAQTVEQGKEKTNVEIKTEMESEAPAHLNQVINPMNDFYPPQEKVAFTKYFLDFSSPITYWREGRGDIFCLKESDEKACVFIIRHFNSWNSPEDAADDILDKYSQQVKDFEIYDRHETFSADGYHAYWAGAHFSIDGKNYETGHLFVQVNNEVFQIMSYATRGIVEKYRQELNHITESFSLSRSE